MGIEPVLAHRQGREIFYEFKKSDQLVLPKKLVYSACPKPEQKRKNFKAVADLYKENGKFHATIKDVVGR